MELIGVSISIIALSVSIFSLYISWRVFSRDKPDLRVSLDYYPQSEGGTTFNVSVTNHGRRVARVEKFTIHFRSGEPLGDCIAGGRPIAETEPFDMWLPIYGSDGPLCDPTEVKFAEVFDTLGNTYTFPEFSIKDWLEFRRLRTKIHQHWDEVKGS